MKLYEDFLTGLMYCSYRSIYSTETKGKLRKHLFFEQRSVMSLVSLFIERGRRHEEVERDSFLERKPENEVLEKFRMSKQEIYALCGVVQADMQPVGHRSTDLTLLNKVLISLKTLASGSFQNCSKDFMHARVHNMDSKIHELNICVLITFIVLDYSGFQ